MLYQLSYASKLQIRRKKPPFATNVSGGGLEDQVRLNDLERFAAVLFWSILAALRLSAHRTEGPDT